MGDQTIMMGVQLETSVPLAWQALADDHDMNLVLDNAIQMLQSLGALEEARSEAIDEDSAIHAELRRLDSKLDLLLRLFGQSLRGKHALPAVTPIRLRRTGVSILVSGELPSRKSRLIVGMYLSKSLPLPLELPGTLVDLHGDGAGTWLEVEFDSLSQVLTDELNRFIFRYHRRAVAESRRARDQAD